MTEMTILGIGIVCFLVLYLAFKLDDKHTPLKVLFLFFTIYLFLLIAKDVYDNKDFCEVIVQNKTVSGSVTSYEYNRVCFENEKNTPSVFYNMVNNILKISYVYLFLFTSYIVLIYVGKVVSNVKKR